VFYKTAFYKIRPPISFKNVFVDTRMLARQAICVEILKVVSTVSKMLLFSIVRIYHQIFG